MRVFSPSTVPHPWLEAWWIVALTALVMWDGYWLVTTLVPVLARLFGPFGWSPPVSS